MSAHDVRSAIKKEFPDLDFSVRKVSFSDLAREDCYVLLVNGRFLSGAQVRRIDEILKGLPVKAIWDKG